MAIVKILGNAFAITSSLKLADIKNVKKFHPEQLVMKNEDKEAVFAIGVGAKASVTACGVTFTAADAEGYAQATMQFPEGITADKREGYIVDEIGGAITTLNAFEAKLSGAVSDLGTELAAVKSNISVVG